VHLRDRGAGDRCRLEGRIAIGEALAKRPFDLGDRLLGGKRRNLVLQLGELLGEIRWQQIAPGGEPYAEAKTATPGALAAISEIPDR
jgi:hypothetical protein